MTRTLQIPGPKRVDGPRRIGLFVTALSAALLAVVFVAFLPVLRADFVGLDDPQNVLENPHLSPLSAENLRWMLTGFLGGHYHPLTWLTLAINKAIWGLAPFGFHLTNLLLHAANAVLLMVLLRRLMGMASKEDGTACGVRSIWVCASLGAALWAVHPLRVESVAWVTERRDVLSTVFLLAATNAYLGAVEKGVPGIRSRRAYLTCVALAVLSCLSKAWGMSFFVLLLALDFYPLRRLPANPARWISVAAVRVFLEKSPLIIIGVVTAVVAAMAQHSGSATKTLAEWPLEDRLVQAAYGLSFYLKASLIPLDLSPFYQLPVRMNPWEGRYLLGYAIDIGALGAVVLCWRRWPAIVTAAAIYVASIMPVLGILQSGEQLVADRYSYIATIPFAALVAGGVSILVRKIRRRGRARTGGVNTIHGEGEIGLGLVEAGTGAQLCLGSLCAVVLAALGCLTFAQCAIWRNTETLWAYASTVTPTFQVLNNYAMELDRQHRRDEALPIFELAVRVNPEDGRAWFSYASVMRDRGRLAEAERGFQEAAKYLPRAFMAYQNLGILYQTHGHPKEAMAAFRLAVQDVEKGGNRELSGGPYMTLGLALLEHGDATDAEQAFRKALRFADTRVAAAEKLRSMEKP